MPICNLDDIQATLTGIARHSNLSAGMLTQTSSQAKDPTRSAAKKSVRLVALQALLVSNADSSKPTRLTNLVIILNPSGLAILLPAGTPVVSNLEAKTHPSLVWLPLAYSQVVMGGKA